MNKKVLILLVAALILFAVSMSTLFYFFVFLPQNPALKTTTLTIGEHAFMVEIADTFMSRAKGLSGRTSLAGDRGMLFVFDTPGNYGFWMRGMKFPLDFVWINGDKVAGVTKNVPPPAGITNLKTYYPPEPIGKVLEVNAGLAAKYNVKAGDSVAVGP